MQNEEIRLEEKLFEVLQELGLQIERKEKNEGRITATDPDRNGCRYHIRYNVEILEESKQEIKIPGDQKSKEVTGKNSVTCVYCNSTSINKNGSQGGIQRYRCKDCRKTFSETSSSLRYHSKLSEQQWKELLRGLVEKLSLSKIAKKCQISTAAVWQNKRKVCMTLMQLYDKQDKLKGGVEFEEYYTSTSFKGKKDPAFFEKYNKAALKKNGIEDVYIVICTDYTGGLYIKPVCAGVSKRKDIENILENILEKDTILMTIEDDKYSFLTESERISYKKAENLELTQNVYERLEEYYSDDGRRMTATKYLDLDFMLFWWLEKNRELSVEEQVEKLYRMISNNNGLENATRKKIRHRELGIDTRGLIPKNV